MNETLTAEQLRASITYYAGVAKNYPASTTDGALARHQVTHYTERLAALPEQCSWNAGGDPAEQCDGVAVENDIVCERHARAVAALEGERS